MPMTTLEQFEEDARQFVIDTLSRHSGKVPSDEIVAQTTKKLVKNFRPVLRATDD